MFTYILLGIIILLAYYSLDTRQRLIRTAEYIDTVNQEINSGFISDRVRIRELELQMQSKRKK